MILYEAINKIVREYVNTVLQLNIYAIKGKQPGAPRPTGPYCDIVLVTDTPLATEERSFENNLGDDDLTETITGIRELMLSLSFYREGAIDNARGCNIALSRSSVSSLFSSAGLGILRKSAVREIFEPFESSWEERAQFDIYISVVGSDVDIVRSIMTVSFSGEFHTRGLKFNLSGDIEE